MAHLVRCDFRTDVATSVEEVSIILVDSMRKLKSCHDAKSKEVGVLTTVWLETDNDWDEVCNQLQDAAGPYQMVPTKKKNYQARAWTVSDGELIARKYFTCVDNRKPSDIVNRQQKRGSYNKCLCNCDGYLLGNEVLFV